MNAFYSMARDRYAELGVDTEAALHTLAHIPVSLHCWQGDDVGGFENAGAELGGGLAVTGAYPGKARTADELRSDLDVALSLIPGRHRLNLHASYAELHGAKISRAEYAIEHFQGWVDWCRERKLGFDFNPTFFAHPLAEAGTLSHRDREVRAFWIAHGIACRRIAAAAAAQVGSAACTNFWIPDGSKDQPVDRRGPRERLAGSLDEIFAASVDPALHVDAVESKLFGLGSESYVVGSHEFYLGYAITRQKLYCLDAGHFHPTESIADKLSSLLQFLPGVLLHLSRGVRWDSDHVVVLDDATRAVMEEAVRGDLLGRLRLGLDFFDASINRIAAWVIGTRAVLQALLAALLEPRDRLRAAEADGDLTLRLALLETTKTLPLGAVWEEHLRRCEVPGGIAWLKTVRRHEAEALLLRR